MSRFRRLFELFGINSKSRQDDQTKKPVHITQFIGTVTNQLLENGCQISEQFSSDNINAVTRFTVTIYNETCLPELVSNLSIVQYDGIANTFCDMTVQKHSMCAPKITNKTGSIYNKEKLYQKC